jgi:aspartate/methionine/tyrosine aminotransferase
LVLDATYEYFVHDDTNRHNDISNSFTACFNHEEHVIHIFSLSKSYGMAGYRIGYMVLPRSSSSNRVNRKFGNEECSSTVTSSSTLYDNVMKVQDTIAIAPSYIGQIAAIGALRNAGQLWVQSKVETLREGRMAIYHALQILQPNVIGGNGAMYYMAQLPYSTSIANNDNNVVNTAVASDIDVAERLIQQYGIAIIPGTFCGAPGWIRICYANLSPDQCQIAAQRLQYGLQSMFGTTRTGIPATI